MRARTNRTNAKPAIGYLRVSTQGQFEDGIGLDGQRAAIEKYAELAGLKILEWHQDAASGMGAGSAAKREGLSGALNQARELRCPVVVSGLDRLSRNTQTVERIVIKEDVELLSTDGATLNKLVLGSRAARAEADGQAISERTKQALQQRKASGVQLGNRTNLHQAQKSGAASNRERSEAKIEEIAEHLRTIPHAGAMSAKEVVDSLNDAGIKSGSGRAWTTSAIRRPLAAAREIIEENRTAAYKNGPNYGRFA